MVLMGLVERMAESPKTGDLELGRKIAGRREELGMSRKELGVAAGLSYPYIAQIETGYRLPSSRHQLRLAESLGWTLDELFGLVEERTEPRRPARRRPPSLEEAVSAASEAIEALPVAVRLEAVSQVQLKIMQGVTEAQASERRGT